jgi:hypothetical protein
MGDGAGGSTDVVVTLGYLVSRIENRTQAWQLCGFFEGGCRSRGPGMRLTGRLAEARLEINACTAPFNYAAST